MTHVSNKRIHSLHSHQSYYQPLDKTFPSSGHHNHISPQEPCNLAHQPTNNLPGKHDSWNWEEETSHFRWMINYHCPLIRTSSGEWILRRSCITWNTHSKYIFWRQKHILQIQICTDVNYGPRGYVAGIPVARQGKQTYKKSGLAQSFTQSDWFITSGSLLWLKSHLQINYMSSCKPAQKTFTFAVLSQWNYVSLVYIIFVFRFRIHMRPFQSLCNFVPSMLPQSNQHWVQENWYRWKCERMD